MNKKIILIYKKNKNTSNNEKNTPENIKKVKETLVDEICLNNIRGFDKKPLT